MMKKQIYKAKVISPRVNCYRIRKRMFFDNLGNYVAYENLKKHSSVSYRQLICPTVQKSINLRNEIYEAVLDDSQNKPNFEQKAY